MSVPASPNTPHPSAASAQGTGLAVLDATALEKLRELDPKGQNKLFERVLGAYAQSLHKLLMNLPEQVGPADVDSVRQMTHTLKSSSASVGALQMAARCAETEKAAKEGDEALWLSNVPLLRAEARRLLDGLTLAGYVADKSEKGISR